MTDKTPMDSFMDAFKTFGADLKLPGPQVDELLDHHRKNLQALQEAAQVASAGGQTMLEKQRAALEESLAAVADMVQKAPEAAKEPTSMISDQAELARKSFEMALKNAGEMNEIARESGMEAFNILRARMQESLSELTAGMTPGKKD
ncbi:MAG: TIGR01841 family phasin [Pseudomonadota bacterium]